MKKILTSRNYKFLTEQKEAAEEAVSPTREGEYKDDVHGINTRVDNTPSSEKSKEKNDSRKRKAQPEENSPRKTRGIRKDYWKLADPFSSNDEDEPNDDEEEMMILMAEAGDELQTLKEAMESPDWPEWECAIKSELGQLQEKETWELVDLPDDAVPLNNKWVFVLKRDKEGWVVKHKA